MIPYLTQPGALSSSQHALDPKANALSARFIDSFAMLALNQKYAYTPDVCLHVFITSAFKCKIPEK